MTDEDRAVYLRLADLLLSHEQATIKLTAAVDELCLMLAAQRARDSVAEE